MSVVAYIAVSLGTIQAAEALVTALHLPPVIPQIITVVLLFGLPVVTVLAWTFDITTQGVKRTEPLASAGSVEREPRIAVVQTGTLPALPETRVKTRSTPEGAPAEDRLQRATMAHLRHELRTPINGIVGYTEMLLEDETDPAISGDLNRILESGHRLLALIDRVLPREATRSDGEDLAALSARVSAELRTPANAVIGYAELLVEQARESGRSNLLPDLNRILQAGRNLVALSTDIVRLASASREQLAQDPSHQQTTALARDVLAHIAPVSPGGVIVEGEGTLLVVDDNATNLDLLSRQLARHGYIVETASDGVEALEKLMRREFDAILLDVIMPRLDGIETLRRIRADERLRDVPVLMLSSLDEVDSAIRCIELGAEEYLSKPFQPVLLEARIAANVKLKRMRQRDRAFSEHLTSTRSVAERLARTVFPADIAGRVLQGERQVQQAWGEATVVACCVSANGATEAQSLERLRQACTLVEECARNHQLDAIVSRGNVTFVLIGGTGHSHAQQAARFALDLAAAAAGAGVPLAVGLHTGSVLAAVVGDQRPRFEMIGDAVSTAEGVALQSAPGSVLVSPSTEHALRAEFVLDARGVAQMANGTHMRTFTLLRPVEAVTA